MYLYIFDATELSEVCYYADPIPSVELTPWRQQWDAESDTESNTDTVVQSDIPWTMEDLEKEIAIIV